MRGNNKIDKYGIKIEIVITILIAISSIVFVSFGLRHFYTIRQALYLESDLAIHFQSLFSTMEGRFLHNAVEAIWTGKTSICYLSSHASFIHLFYIPFLYLFRSPETLVLGTVNIGGHRRSCLFGVTQKMFLKLTVSQI